MRLLPRLHGKRLAGRRVEGLSFVLFDLDGTLTDPGEGITNSVIYAMKAHGFEPPPRDELYSVIGPPLSDSFRRLCGVDREKAAEMILTYREYYADKGIYENALYPGITGALARLRDAGKTLAVATSKPEMYALRIIEHFGLSPYFALVGGCLPDESRVKKAEVIAYVLAGLGAAPESAVMVGDRKYDIEGAAANGVRSIGVLYGYGSAEELRQAGASLTASDPAAVADIILG